MSSNTAAPDERGHAIPDRAEWPYLPPHSTTGQVLTELILTTFRLNARLMEAAQGMAAAGGITATGWQVLGGVLDQPRSVADVGRLMGMSRQGVQRIADLLVEQGLARYQPNPAHRRAKLLACTEAGHWSIRQIALRQHPWTDAIGSAVGPAELSAAQQTMNRLVDLLDADDSSQRPGVPRTDITS